MSSSALERLASYHPIISCEGAAEEIVIGKLIEADVLVFPSSNLVGITRLRKATRIQEKYLNYDYDWPVCILRVLDSPREKFSLRKLYRDRFKVYSIYTRPEIEILIIIREDNWDSWKRSGIKPSEYCTQVMHSSYAYISSKERRLSRRLLGRRVAYLCRTRVQAPLKQKERRAVSG